MKFLSSVSGTSDERKTSQSAIDASAIDTAKYFEKSRVLIPPKTSTLPLPYWVMQRTFNNSQYKSTEHTSYHESDVC